MFISQERKRLVEILLVILIVLGLVTVIAVILKKNQEGGVANPDRTILEAPLPEGFDPNVVNGAPTYTAEPTARAFVERFGSFSSESGYGNIDDVLVLATEGFQPELERIAQEARAEENEGFYGISTRVIGLSKQAETATTLELLIGTLRTESIDSPANSSTRLQNVTVDMELVGGRWLVAGFTWE